MAGLKSRPFFIMDTVIFLLKVLLVFNACISGVLTALFVMLALKFKDLI